MRHNVTNLKTILFICPLFLIIQSNTPPVGANQHDSSYPCTVGPVEAPVIERPVTPEQVPSTSECTFYNGTFTILKLSTWVINCEYLLRDLLNCVLFLYSGYILLFWQTPIWSPLSSHAKWLLVGFKQNSWVLMHSWFIF